jgi:hypothetical protein
MRFRMFLTIIALTASMMAADTCKVTVHVKSPAVRSRSRSITTATNSSVRSRSSLGSVSDRSRLI